MDQLYGLEIAEKIHDEIITEEEYLQLVKEIGEGSADKYVIPLTKRYVHPSPKEIVKIKQQQQLKQSRVKTLIHARKEKGIDYVSGIGVPDLESFAHNDFQWDCIIYVDGHSDIDERVADLKNYTDILPDLEVVTIASSEVSTYCLAADNAIDTLIKTIEKRGHVSPMDVAILLNTELREDPSFKKKIHKEDAADAELFLKSTVQISTSTSQYYERDWNFYERSGKNSGHLLIQNAEGVFYLLSREERRPGSRAKLTKTEILRRALPFGKRPLFVDIGCLIYSTPRVKEIWETNLKTRGFILGGKRHIKRKLTKRPKVKKLIHFT
jgi:hypothetical protein